MRPADNVAVAARAHKGAITAEVDLLNIDLLKRDIKWREQQTKQDDEASPNKAAVDDLRHSFTLYSTHLILSSRSAMHLTEQKFNAVDRPSMDAPF